MSIIKKDIPAEYRVLIQKLRLIDDTFFNVCFDNYTEGMQLLLRIFFDRDDLVVRRVVTQQSADNLYGRGVRFDVLAEDSEGKLYDCEVQRANEGAAARRARYNSSMMDSRALAKGAEFAALPETWVIFITENDIYQAGCPLYHVERIIQETQRPFDDGVYCTQGCGHTERRDGVKPSQNTVPMKMILDKANPFSWTDPEAGNCRYV